MCRKISNTWLRRNSGQGVPCAEESQRVIISNILATGAFWCSPHVGCSPEALGKHLSSTELN